MRVTVQRVSRANVKVDGIIVGKIDRGLVCMLGISKSDDDKVIKWMSNKLVNLRIFNDGDGRKNISVSDINGGILLISNFTLYGEIRKGSRPNFGNAASQEIAEPIYNKMLDYLRSEYDVLIQAGEFGTMMEVELVNDGPITLNIEKEAKPL